jgi:hypothetical protein
MLFATANAYNPSLPMLRLIASVLIAGFPATAASCDVFESKIRPILGKNCYACHTDSSQGASASTRAPRCSKGAKEVRRSNPAGRIPAS